MLSTRGPQGSISKGNLLRRHCSVPPQGVHNENTRSWRHFGSKISNKFMSYSKPFQSYTQPKKHVFWQFTERMRVVRSYVKQSFVTRSCFVSVRQKKTAAGFNDYILKRRIRRQNVQIKQWTPLMRSGTAKRWCWGLWLLLWEGPKCVPTIRVVILKTHSVRS
jgi:hypothetical protein